LDIGSVLRSNGQDHDSRQTAPTFALDYIEMDSLHHFIFNVYEVDSIALNEYLDRVVFNKSKQYLGDEGIETIVSQGDFADTILETATKLNVDIIVMGTYSRRD
jgi:putative hydrolase of the HAD superfamily